MSKSQNPYPKEFNAIFMECRWNGVIRQREVRVIADNGWYRVYPKGSWGSIGKSYRYYELTKLFEQGRLFMPDMFKEDVAIGNLESII